MLCGRPPFKGQSNTEILTNVIKGEYTFEYPSFEQCSDDCKDFIKKCLLKDPSKRLSADQAYQHPWIKANWSKVMPSITISESVPS